MTIHELPRRRGDETLAAVRLLDALLSLEASAADRLDAVEVLDVVRHLGALVRIAPATFARVTELVEGAAAMEATATA